MSNVKLIVGLGNYPQEYSKTRHNIGFMVIDKLCKDLHISLTQEKFNGKFIKVDVDGVTFVIGEPLTYMSLSGDFVGAISNFYKIEPQNILIVSDDADTSVGTIRIKKTGSSGGQNGLKDIINKLGSENFLRMKIGIGRPTNKKINLADYVLSTFNSSDKPIIGKIIEKAVEAIVEYMNGSAIDQVMNKYNLTIR